MLYYLPKNVFSKIFMIKAKWY